MQIGIERGQGGLPQPDTALTCTDRLVESDNVLQLSVDGLNQHTSDSPAEMTGNYIESNLQEVMKPLRYCW